MRPISVIAPAPVVPQKLTSLDVNVTSDVAPYTDIPGLHLLQNSGHLGKPAVTTLICLYSANSDVGGITDFTFRVFGKRHPAGFAAVVLVVFMILFRDVRSEPVEVTAAEAAPDSAG